MRRRQSSRFMTPPRTGNESRFLAPRKHSEHKKRASLGMASTRMDAIEGRTETELESRKLKVERKTFGEDGLDGYSWGDLAPMHWGLAAGKTVTGSFLERAETRSKSGSGGVNGGRCRIWHRSFFNFRHEGGADDGGVGEAAENGDVAGEREAEADGNGEFRDGAGPAQERGQIVGESIFRAGNTGAGDEIEEAGGAGGDFSEALVSGSGSAKEDGVEMISGEDAAIVAGFFGCQVGGENAISTRGFGGGCEFFEAHLQNGIVVAEEDKRDIARWGARLADAADEIEDAGKRGARFQGAFGSALDGRAVGERIAERDAEFDDVGASFRKFQDKLLCGIQGRIASGDVRHDAELAGSAQFSEAFGDAGRIGGSGGHFSYVTAKRSFSCVTAKRSTDLDRKSTRLNSSHS